MGSRILRLARAQSTQSDSGLTADHGRGHKLSSGAPQAGILAVQIPQTFVKEIL